MMRAIATTLGGALLTLMTLFAVYPETAGGAATSWVLVDENPGTEFFYDKAGTSLPREGIIRVPVRVVYSDQGKSEALEVLKHPSGYDKLSETHYVYDLDCRKQKLHLLRVTHLDDAGSEIKAINLSADTEWDNIPPNSRLELLSEQVCKQ